MYDGKKYLGVIDFKNEGSFHTKVAVKDSEDKKVFTGETKNCHALMFSDGKIYYDADDCIVSEQISQKEITLNGGIRFKIKGI